MFDLSGHDVDLVLAGLEQCVGNELPKVAETSGHCDYDHDATITVNQVKQELKQL